MCTAVIMDTNILLISTVYLVSVYAAEFAPCGGKPADVFFLLDSSGSIATNDFQKELKFTKDVTSMFDTRPEKVRVGIASFSKNVIPQFGLGEYNNKDNLLNKIADVNYEGLGTNTGEALSYLHVKAMSPENVRPDVPHIAIVLTDGMSQDSKSTLKEARLVHEAGIAVFVIGIGTQVDKTEMEAIASQPSKNYVFEVANFDALASIKEALAIKACEVQKIPVDVQNTAAEVEAELLSYGSCTPRHPLDLVFAVDTAAIGASNAKFVLQFIGNVSDHINMESGDTSIATLGNGCSGGTFREEALTNANAVKQGLSTYQAPQFDQLLLNMRLKAVDGRMTAKHVGVLFVSDRLSPSEYLKSTLEVKRALFKKVSIYVVGVGDRVDEYQAKSFAINGGTYFRAFSFETLGEVGSTFLHKLCLFGSEDK